MRSWLFTCVLGIPVLVFMLAQPSPLPSEPPPPPREVFCKRDLKVTVGSWHQGFLIACTLSLFTRLDKLAFDKILALFPCPCHICSPRTTPSLGQWLKRRSGVTWISYGPEKKTVGIIYSLNSGSPQCSDMCKSQCCFHRTEDNSAMTKSAPSIRRC